MRLIACGLCTDMALGPALPFLWYWLLLLLGWVVLWGPAAAVLELVARGRLSFNPLRFAALWLPVFAAVWLVNAWGLLLPGLVVVPVWLWRVHKRKPAEATDTWLARVESSARRVTLSAAALLIPVAYARLILQRLDVLPSAYHWLNEGLRFL